MKHFKLKYLLFVIPFILIIALSIYSWVDMGEAGAAQTKIPNRVSKIIAWAQAQIGTSYFYGGTCTNSHSGESDEQVKTHCDCSSLVQQAYLKGGSLSLPRTTQAQIGTGSHITVKNIQAGDLVFSSTKHVAMYIGYGKIIEAPHTGDVVKTMALSYYSSNPTIIRPTVLVNALKKDGDNTSPTKTPTPTPAKPTKTPTPKPAKTPKPTETSIIIQGSNVNTIEGYTP